MYSDPVDILTSIVRPADLEPKATPHWRLEQIRKKLQFGPDLIVFAVAFTLAYLLRFDFVIPQHERSRWLVQLPIVILIQFGALRFFGVYKFIWRYVGMAEIKSFLRAACVALLPIVGMRLLLPSWFDQFRVPASVILMNSILGFGGALGLRVGWRALYETYERPGKKSQTLDNDSFIRAKKSVLLIGAGRTGMLTAREIRSRSHLNLEVKGFVDDAKNKVGSVIEGVEVVGTSQDLPRLVHDLKIDHVVITIANASRKAIRQLVRICERIPVKARIVPGLHELVGGTVEVNSIRDLQIEDLLGREPVQLDEEEMERFLVGKTIMVTGAGGSIGSELACQVARFKPASLLLVERAEFSLFEIDRGLRQKWPELSIVPIVADIGDETRMRAIFGMHLPNVVLHAAAHKHVPMMESNVCEVVKNNILATRLLGELAGQYETDVFILISTDKAVRPTSVMGASKRVGELVVQNLNQRFATRYAAVRFGNVVGSAGSVIPIFREQIRQGGPVTVTHPDMIRYFMTIPEAAQLVLQAGAITEGGEIFVLDMGEPVNILSLAKDIIMLSGFKPFEDIDIIFTGVRPGEKLFEELETSEEHLAKTRHRKIFIGKMAILPEQQMAQVLRWLTLLSKRGREQELRNYLTRILPESRLERGDASQPHIKIESATFDRSIVDAEPKRYASAGR